MKVEGGDQLLAELDTSDRVAERVQGRRPEGDTHHVWNDQEDGATDPGFGGKTNFECKLSAVVVHSTRVHQT